MLSIINSLGTFIVILMISLNYSDNLNYFLSVLWPMVNFDIFSWPFTQLIWEKWWSFSNVSNDVPLNSQFDSIGFSSSLFLKNFGMTLSISCAFTFIKIAFLCVMAKTKWHKKIKNKSILQTIDD
jgi:hypothetical protein